MSKKTIKPRKFLFFATFFYGLLFWILLPATLLSAILSIDPSQKNWGAAIAITVVLALATIGMGVLRNVRRKALSLKLPIRPINLPYTSEELKHYLGLQPSDTFKDEYFAMVRAYMAMKKSKMMFVVTSREDVKEVRSAAKHYIETAKTKLDLAKCPVLFLKQEVPVLLDAQRNSYYLLPHFVLRIAGKKDITAFSYKDFDLTYSDSSYILGYDEKVPKDAEIIGKAYEHSNKDGSPDLRVANNPYTYNIATGCIISEPYNIEYHFSNANAAEAFHNAYLEFANSALEANAIKETVQNYPKEQKSV